MINVNGIDFEFNYATKGKFAILVNDLMISGKPFKIETKNTFAIFIPKDLTAYFSINKSFMTFQTLEAMQVQIGIMLTVCKNIVSSRIALEHEIKLLKN